jgi:beta-alanine--pyruvate transaminase
VLIPPVGYLDRLRAICDRHGILLIFDEVITGFGRLGAAFGAQKFGVVPDMMTMAKGITNAAVPMGAVATRADIYRTVVESAAPGIELFHGYTYSGHPLAAAAGLATLALYREEGLFERAASLEEEWMSAGLSLRGSPHVVDIRTIGLVTGIELESRPGELGTRAFEVFRKCFEAGVLVRAAGETIAISPPLIVEREQIARIVETLGQALRATH